MTAKILELSPSPELFEELAKTVKAGGIVVIPTETSYGICVNATDDDAVRKVFEIKERPKTKPVLIIVSDMEMLKDYVELDGKSRTLIHKFMPGPLTLVLRKKEDKLAKSLSRSGIAIRIPGTVFAREFCRKCGIPITASSANISGMEPMYHISDVIREFSDKVDLIVDGGDLQHTPPTTLIEMRFREPMLLREGPIPFEQILKVLDEVKE